MDLICGIVDFHNTPDVSGIVSMAKHHPATEKTIVSDEYSSIFLCENGFDDGKAIYSPETKQLFLISTAKSEWFYVFSGSSLIFSSSATTLKSHPALKENLKNTISYVPAFRTAVFSRRGLTVI